MTLRGLRSLALGALALVVLSGCAVPGGGDPGVATTYRDRVITHNDVLEMKKTLDQLYSSPHPGEALTLLLVGPGAVAIAQNLGVNFTEAGLNADAEMWMAAQGSEILEASPEAIELVLQVRALAYVLNDPDGVAQMIALVQDIEANSTTNPRYGDFTLENFSSSITAIQELLAESQSGLGPAKFLVYKEVNGFAAQASPEWISGG